MAKRDWPVLTDIDTSSVDSNADKPNRGHFFNLFEAVWSIVRGRNRANGVASLDSNRRLRNDQMGRNVAGGVAPLGSDSKVPAANLPSLAAIPIGCCLPYAGGIEQPNPPGWPGWAYCDGRWIAKTGYPELWRRIGDWHLAGEAARTNQFRIPDFRGRFLIGWRDGGAYGSGGGRGGNRTLTLTENHIPRHRHKLAGGAYADATAAATGQNTMAIADSHGGEATQYLLKGRAGEPNLLNSGAYGTAAPSALPIDPVWTAVQWIIRTK